MLYVLLSLICWVAIYLSDSVIHPLYNWALVPGLHVFLKLSSQFIIFSLTESTLHMLGRNEIQEAIHRTSDPEKFETDLITALSHFIRQTHRTGKCQKYFAFISVWPVSPHMTILQEVVA